MHIHIYVCMHMYKPIFLHTFTCIPVFTSRTCTHVDTHMLTSINVVQCTCKHESTNKCSCSQLHTCTCS